MATINVNGGTYTAENGTLLSDIIAPNHRLSMPCGGKKRCGKCKVIATGALSPVSEAEKRFLSAEEIDQNVRLACCTTVQGDCEVRLFEEKKGTISTDGELPQLTISPMFRNYGVAIDIGTTTLAARLYDTRGNKLADASELNPQSGYGADVISRIEASMGGAST
ncbi:MAG: 2Fe-2S iron-sulfur cluster binding domain-containing protein, partial [Clostridia bacterium]|nr:2Fe-2S iron-sulfur cluster binding domain-containing protein [Clostridia bacterium]